MLNSNFLTGGLIAAFITFVAVLILKPISRPLQLIDYPKGRKDHTHPTPVIGGLAIAAGIFITTWSLLPTSNNLAAYTLSAALLVITGQLDDKYDLPWQLRILIQVTAALIASLWGNTTIENLGPLFGTQSISLGVWSIPFTVLITVGLINAINMVDGIDGFAGSLSAVALCLIAATAFYNNAHQVAIFSIVAIGAIGTFLFFNIRFPWRPRARIFLGNGGSALLGFTLAWASIHLLQTTPSSVSPSLCLWFVPVPIIDCVTLILRRLKTGRSPFKADHNHLHHLMREAGASPNQTVLIFSSLSFFTGFVALQSLNWRNDGTLLTILFLSSIFGWYWISTDRTRTIVLLSHLTARKLNDGKKSDKQRTT